MCWCGKLSSMLWFSCISGATQDSQQQILLRTLPVSRRMGQKKPRTAQSLFHNCDGVSCLRASQFQERGSRLWFSAHDKACSIKALHWSQPPGKPRGPRLHPACSGGLCIPRARAGGALEGGRWLEGSDTQFYEGCPSLGHCAGSVGSECVRKVQ